MSHKFKAGDLALIVGAVKCQENIGKTVTVGELVGRGDVCPDGSIVGKVQGPVFVSYGDSLVVSKYHRNGEYAGNVKSKFALCRPEHLIPLRGDFQPESEREEELTR